MKEIFEPATLNDRSKTKYGFGWEIEDIDPCGKMTGHGGGWPGYSTYIARYVENDKTIIILQNHDSDILVSLEAIRKILYYKPLSIIQSK